MYKWYLLIFKSKTLLTKSMFLSYFMNFKNIYIIIPACIYIDIEFLIYCIDVFQLLLLLIIILLLLKAFVYKLIFYI